MVLLCQQYLNCILLRKEAESAGRSEYTKKIQKDSKAPGFHNRGVHEINFVRLECEVIGK